MSERSILAAKNKDVDNLNATTQNSFPGELFTYKSIDTATNQNGVVNYYTEFLSSLELPGAILYYIYIGSNCNCTKFVILNVTYHQLLTL